MKRKREDVNEPSNLKRFKFVIGKFNREHKSEWAAIQGTGGVRELQKKTQTLSRKERRKQDRKLKKMRKHAFNEHKPIPTRESIEKEKKAAEKAEKMSRIKEKKRLKKKEKKKKAKTKEKEESDTHKQGLLEANKAEDKTIKQLEKQLKMKNRKNKSLPLSFKNDGLDYLLEAVDTENLSKLYKENKEDVSDDEDLPKASWDIDEDDSEESQDELSDRDQNLEDISDYSDLEENIKIADLTESADTTSILKKSKDKKKQDKDNKKSVHFDSGDSNNDYSDDLDIGSNDGSYDSDSSVDQPVSGKPSKVGEEKHKSAKRTVQTQPKNIKSKKKKGKDDLQNSESDENLSGNEELSDLSDQEMESEPVLKEDIYGRLRDTKGNIQPTTGAYIPPAKRREMATTADGKRQLELERISKQLKGLLNRLSEANVQGISSQVEETYRSHSRMDVTETLTSLVLDACVAATLIPERLIMEHCMLIAILHGNVGTEVGAYFLQIMAKKFDILYSDEKSKSTKELDNLLVVLANIYNFKIVHSLLIFDVIRKLVESFGEKDIELILLLLKNVGFSLRKDDPVTLKEVIIMIQAKSADLDISQVSDPSRVRFMLDVLLAIKNNNMRKIPNYDPSHLDHLRKLLRNYVKGSSLGEGELRISLQDLLLAEEKGRWWLVGSAWSGRQEEETQHGVSSNLLPATGDVSAHILDLARQQRMNTDVRKNIFCIIMTCEDFVDAFEKLLRLSLKHQQEREIIHVIIDLCAQEKAFNPFYAFLAQKFAEYDRRFQMTIQFTLWDKFKALGEMAEQKMSNTAAFLTHLLATKALSLSVFKVIEFGELDKPQVRFLKMVLSSLLLDQPEHVIKDIFTRIASLPKLQILREGLKLFMKHFLLRNKKNTDSESRRLLEDKVEVAERALTSADAKMLL